MKSFSHSHKIIVPLLTGICLLMTACGTDTAAPTLAETIPAAVQAETSAASVSADASTEETASASSADYSVCTSLPASDVEAFALKVKTAILADDMDSLSEMCAYPITIGDTEYKDAASLKAASITFSDTFLSDIRQESCTSLFANSDGIMLGSGEVWISEVLNEDLSSQGLKIISINLMD